jgi:hypothetical protein
MNSNSSSFSTSKYPDPRERSGEFRTLAVTGSIVCASFLAGGAYLGYIFKYLSTVVMSNEIQYFHFPPYTTTVLYSGREDSIRE